MKERPNMTGVIPEDPAARLAQYEAFAAELDEFLHGDGLSRLVVIQLAGRTLKPNMTLGLLHDTRDALDSDLENLTRPERERLAEADALVERVRDRDVDAYRAKLRQELKSSLDSWSWYLTGCEEEDEDCSETYPSEVWIRTRLADLLVEARGVGLDTLDEEDRLSELDNRLRARFLGGAFVGPPGQESARPAGEYWWLYGGPLPTA
jgi:hypothetical protein